ncbi:MAG: wax ester/triacylglycerol synthase family O-acyltransferase [Deltaproteobacteria bacterium]|nr:wax ester/triacylglycerol synthase family O-acyltransferase [Deltaproteobacteria bacterium]
MLEAGATSPQGPDFERLGAQDSSFLMFEGRHTPMHVSALALFEAPPLPGRTGGFDFERIRDHVAAGLHRLPRYRQRIVATPVEGHPIWIDDEHFNLDYHVRHTCLPPPGDESALESLVGRILSQQLDRKKPLWEIWVVEGLEGGRFALLLKVHHCMVDGVGGMALLEQLLSASPDARPEPAPAWVARPRPSGVRLLADAILRRGQAPAEAMGALLDAAREPRRTAEELGHNLTAMLGALREGFRIPDDTPHNRKIGSHRRVGWLSLDLAELKSLRRSLDCTVNDLVLTLVTGGIRRFLAEREVDLEGLDYRVVIPVNVRAFRQGDEDASGNRVSAWFLSLPVAEPDPHRRLELIREATSRLRESEAAVGMDLFTRVVEWTGSSLLTYAGVRLAARVHPYNLIVSNVPGPQFPLYLLGARMARGGLGPGARARWPAKRHPPRPRRANRPRVGPESGRSLGLDVRLCEGSFEAKLDEYDAK